MKKSSLAIVVWGGAITAVPIVALLLRAPSPSATLQAPPAAHRQIFAETAVVVDSPGFVEAAHSAEPPKPELMRMRGMKVQVPVEEPGPAKLAATAPTAAAGDNAPPRSVPQ